MNGDGNAQMPRAEAFLQALQDLGYIEGKSILVEQRYFTEKRSSPSARGRARAPQGGSTRS